MSLPERQPITSDIPEAAPVRAPGPRRRGRHPWAWALTALVGAAALVPLAAVRDAASLASVPGVHLRLSVPWLLVAPAGDVLDALALLSIRQHVALLVTALLVFAGWRVWRSARRPAPPHRHWARRVGRETAAVAACLTGLVALYALAALAPRPMAALAVDDPDVLTLDVHSHTNASWDGRSGFTAAANRAWHRRAGFDVAVITDHRSFDGARAAAAANPARAGDGTVLLPGLEIRSAGRHLVLLGLSLSDTTLLATADLDRARAIAPVDSDGPVSILTIPGPLQRLADDTPGTLGRVVAFELSDASPKGFSQTDRDGARLVRIADSLHLAVVAGSDNHGWGHTPAAWTLVRLPGWRGMSPDALDRALRRAFHRDGPAVARVVERRAPGPAGVSLALIATVPRQAWWMSRVMSPGERASWLVWIWGLALTASWWRARRNDRERAG